MADLDALTSLGSYTVTGILAESERAKSLATVGTLGGQRAIVRVTKKHLPVQSVDAVGAVLSERMALSCTLRNDVYAKYDGVDSEPGSGIGAVNVDVICPASDKHVAKYSAQARVMRRETAVDAAQITVPALMAKGAGSLGWVYNILDGSAEADRVVYRSDSPESGFVVLPDLKWDGATEAQLYCVAIVEPRNIGTLRDVRGEHLPLLEAIATDGVAAVAAAYGASPDQLRAFVHYPPSYVHLHVHITHVDCDIADTSPGRAVLLDDIISNLKVFGGDYYAKATLQLCVPAESDIAELLLPTTSATAAASDATTTSATAALAAASE